MCGGIFSNQFIADCPRNVPVKKFLKSVNIWRRYRQSHNGTFLGLSVLTVLRYYERQTLETFANVKRKRGFLSTHKLTKF